MKTRTFLLSIPLVSLLWGCTTTSTPIPSLSPTVTSSPEPTATVLPSVAPKPTDTIQPTASFTPTPSGRPLYLSDLKPYGNPENIEGGLQKDRVYWQREIWINGVHYLKGLGMHAPSSGVGRVRYRVPRGYTVFIALIGLAWQDGNPSCTKEGNARFRVYVDDEIVFESKMIAFGQTQAVRIPVVENNILMLEVDHGGDDYTCDHSTWAEARFEP